MHEPLDGVGARPITFVATQEVVVARAKYSLAGSNIGDEGEVGRRGQDGGQKAIRLVQVLLRLDSVGDVRDCPGEANELSCVEDSLGARLEPTSLSIASAMDAITKLLHRVVVSTGHHYFVYRGAIIVVNARRGLGISPFEADGIQSMDGKETIRPGDDARVDIPV